jgi:transcriptional regulator of arginine metabolism
MNSRKARLPEIIDILAHQVISSQEDLSHQLALRGYTITQATLSRDLKLLKANKVTDDHGSYRYVVGMPNGFARPNGTHIKADANNEETIASVLSVTITGNLVVIKTRNGYASGLACDIANIKSDLVLGTIPGIDTAFVAVKEDAPRDTLFNLFSALLPAAVMEEARDQFIPVEE